MNPPRRGSPSRHHSDSTLSSSTPASAYSTNSARDYFAAPGDHHHAYQPGPQRLPPQYAGGGGPPPPPPGYPLPPPPSFYSSSSSGSGMLPPPMVDGGMAGPSTRPNLQGRSSDESKGGSRSRRKGGKQIDSDLEEAARAVARGKGKERALEETWRYGPPLAVREGMFAGKVLRFAIQCVQQPVHGRRKTDKDRRSLAPVPIIRLRIRECHPDPYDRGWREEDMDISNVETSFLVCAAELSKPSSAPPDSVLDTQQTEGPPNVRGFGEPSVDSSLSGVRPGLQNVASFAVRTRDPILPMQYIEEGSSSGPGPGPSSSALRHRASWVADGHWDSSSLRDDMHQEPTQSSFRVPSQPERVRRRVRASEAEDSSSAGEEMEAEQSRTSKKFRTGMQRNLYGSLHVSAVRVIDPDGVMGLWFLFTDLSIRLEGTYSLRFRTFDLSIVSSDTPPVPDLGTCESQTFKVYSPRNFPGLPKPTELSEHFVRQGFKLNTRKNERQIKTPSPSPPPT